VRWCIVLLSLQSLPIIPCSPQHTRDSLQRAPWYVVGYELNQVCILTLKETYYLNITYESWQGVKLYDCKVEKEEQQRLLFLACTSYSTSHPNQVPSLPTLQHTIITF